MVPRRRTRTVRPGLPGPAGPGCPAHIVPWNPPSPRRAHVPVKGESAGEMSWLTRTPPAAKLTTVVTVIVSPGGSSLRESTQLPLGPESPLADADEADAATATPPIATAPVPSRTRRRFSTCSSIAPSSSLAAARGLTLSLQIRGPRHHPSSVPLAFNRHAWYAHWWRLVFT